MSRAIALGGVALHAGLTTSVVLRGDQGPLRIIRAGLTCPVEELRVLRSDAGVAVGDSSDALRVDLVEHLLAAAAGLGLTKGLAISIYGPEPPLLDGGAQRWAMAMRQLGIPRAPPAWRVAGDATVAVGESRYEFVRSEEISIRVRIEYDHPCIAEREAEWLGGEDDFANRIAPARTFGFFEDAVALRAAGRALGANLRDVIVLTRDGRSLSDPGPLPDECARHKLLDLLGDCCLLCGGPLLGRIEAVRPGHGASHRALREAIATGLVSRVAAPRARSCEML